MPAIFHIIYRFLLRILKTTYVHTPTNKMQIQIRIQNMVMMKNWKTRKQLQVNLLAYCKLYKNKKYLQGENFYWNKSFAISQMAYSNFKICLLQYVHKPWKLKFCKTCIELCKFYHYNPHHYIELAYIFMLRKLIFTLLVWEWQEKWEVPGKYH